MSNPFPTTTPQQNPAAPANGAAPQPPEAIQPETPAEEEIEVSDQLEALDTLRGEVATARERLNKSIARRLEAIQGGEPMAQEAALKFLLEEMQQTVMPLLDELSGINLQQHQFVSVVMEEDAADEDEDVLDDALDEDPTVMRLSVGEVELLLELLVVLQTMAAGVLHPPIAQERRRQLEEELKKNGTAQQVAAQLAEYDEGQQALTNSAAQAAGMAARLRQWLQTQ